MDESAESQSPPIESVKNGREAAHAAQSGAPNGQPTGKREAGQETPYGFPLATSAQPVPEGASLDHPALYFNRELSWLDFNWRVLAQAVDRRSPLLERVRFAAITASNLDEFFQKRMGYLYAQLAAGSRERSPDGRSSAEQLALCSRASREMHQRMTHVWQEELKGELQSRAGVSILDFSALEPEEKQQLSEWFRTHIYPILTPLAVDPGHPFPFISNLSLSLAIIVRHPTRKTTHFARVKVPRGRWRFIPVEGRHHTFVPLEQIIVHHISDLFRGMEVVSAHVFRVTRSAFVSQAQEAADLLSLISQQLRARRFASVVRLEIEREMPPQVRQLLMKELALEEGAVYEVDGFLDLTDLFSIAELDLPEHRYEDWEPVVPTPLLREGETDEVEDIFAIIRRGDILVQHPYESFMASVQRLVTEASEDPDVVAIKQTLYRTAEESPTVRALTRAAESGKQVAVMVEVQARFDEAANIEWGQMLEDAGVHVAYGLVGLKTHAKVTLIVREEEDGLRTYCHIGTGNYHYLTARQYTDIGLLTCNPDLGYDLINLFHYLTGYAPEQQYRKLIVAPRDMRNRIEALIEREIEHQQNHGTGRIIAKMNALEDVQMIQALYRASQAGVQIDLIVRGATRLRPGLPGYSENIRLISILGRFLEHDRIYYFHNNDDPLTLIGSADWRMRNLDNRVEAFTPVETPKLRKRLTKILDLALKDNRLAWELDASGRYRQRHPGPKEKARSFQQMLMRRTRRRAIQADVPWDIEISDTD